MGRLISILAIYLALVSYAFGSATDIYLGNANAGTADGSSCANAKIWTFFNTAGNWGAGSTQIGAGTTVHICGTITASSGSSMTFQGSGSVGSPVTVKFESGAVMQAPFWGSGADEGACPCTGAFTVSGKSNVVIDGGGTPTSNSATNPAGLSVQNGTIQNTANGTGLANGSFAPGIYIHNGTNVVVQNLVIKNLYKHLNTDGGGLGPRQSVDIIVDGTSSGVIIQHNLLNNAGKGLSVEGDDSASPTTVAYNVTSDHCWQMWVTDSATPNIFGNEMTNWDNWNTNGNDCHTDGIIAYGGVVTPIIYNNYIHGSLGGGSPTAYIYCTCPTGGTACPSPGSQCSIFNNVFVQDESPFTRTPIAFYGDEGNGTAHVIYNNTTVVLGTGSAGPLTVFTTQTHELFNYRNNIYSGAGDSGEIAIDFENGFTNQIQNSDFNDWFNLRDASLGFPGFPSGKTFAQWKSNPGFDTHSTEANPSLGASFPYALQPGAPGIGAATNLTSLCTGRLVALCQDRMGNARPPVGNWDMGATQFSSTPVNPPALAPAIFADLFENLD